MFLGSLTRWFYSVVIAKDLVRRYDTIYTSGRVISPSSKLERFHELFDWTTNLVSVLITLVQ